MLTGRVRYSTGERGLLYLMEMAGTGSWLIPVIRMQSFATHHPRVPAISLIVAAGENHRLFRSLACARLPGLFRVEVRGDVQEKLPVQEHVDDEQGGKDKA